MELKEMIDDLPGLGCGSDQKEAAKHLYDTGRIEDLIRYLKKCRCSLWTRCTKARDGWTGWISLSEKQKKKKHCNKTAIKTGGTEK